MLPLRLHPAPYGKDLSEAVHLQKKIEVKGLDHKILKLKSLKKRFMKKDFCVATITVT